MATGYDFGRVTTGVASRHQEQVPSVGASVSTASPGRRQNWRQRLHMWRAERRRESLRSLDYLWDAQHEQVWTQTADSYLDFIIKESGPGLRLAICHHLAFS